MKVSIIIPCYNCEDYLGRCIDSAVRQTHEDIEIILINDGSSDSTGEICRAYAGKDARIRLIDQENGGVSAARNKGLDAAAGELITFIDSDDVVEEDYVEYLTGLLELNGSDIACCGHDDTIREDPPRLIEGSEECLRVYLTSNEIFASVWGKIYRREIFDGIRFPEGRRFEDNFVLFRLIDRCRCITVGYLQKYHYLIRPESFVSEPFSRAQTDIIDAMMLQRQFIEDHHPSLVPYANSLVVYAANRCLVKMADSDTYDKECVDRIRPLYKEYGKDFLDGPGSRSAKDFYKVARISPKLAMRFYRSLHK
ncbi:MAG: glycosyltransferase family 2 protein [Clostridiales bacterium]|nr:glycosyltransferase family 2 protein [Clostridiales bacterium]